MPGRLRFLAVLWILLGSLLALFPLSPATAREAGPGTPGTIRAAELPPEGRETLALIKRGGPFPYAKDGTVFGNFERRLPRQPRGWYREYTVKTPGSRDRGARRIVAGGEQPPGVEFYYTDDHYQSFRRIQE